MSRRLRQTSLTHALIAATAAAATTITAARPAAAETFTWNGLGANNFWNTGLNWQGGVVPPSSAGTAIVMTGSTQTSNTLNLGGFTLNSLTFAAEAAPFAIGQAGGDFFTFSPTPGAGALPHIDQFSTSNQSINFPTTGFQLMVDTLLGGTGTGTVTLNAQLVAGGRLVMNGPYTVVVTPPAAPNTHGGMTINAGTLRVAQDTALGGAAATVIFGGGTLQLASAFSTGRSVVLNAGGGTIDANGFNVSHTNVAATFTGPGRLTLTNTSTASAGVFSLFGQLQQTGGLTVTGVAGANNTATLSGTNTYTGGTTISGGGRLAIDADSRLGNVAGGITIDAGSLRTTNVGTFTTNRTITLGAGGGTMEVSGAPFGLAGAISGSGGLTKIGPGNLGVLTANTFSGPTTVAAGVIQSGHPLAFQNSTVVMAGGGWQFITGGNSVLGGLAGSGTFPVSGPTNLDIGNNNASTTFAGNLTGSIGGVNGLSKIGTGTWTLSGNNGQLGQFRVAAGAVVAAAPGALSPNAPIIVLGGATLDLGGFAYFVTPANPLQMSGTLRLNGAVLNVADGASASFPGSGTNVQMNFGTIAAQPGSNVSYFNASLFNGYLAGAGAHQLNGGNLFSNVTAHAGTNLTQTGGGVLTLSNSTINGSLTGDGNVAWFNGSLGAAGALTINSAASTSGFTSSGRITVNNGGTLSHAGGALVAGGGSITTVNGGGTIQLNGNDFDLHGALLSNNGTIAGAGGTLNVFFGSLAAGTGTFPSVVIHPGGSFTPGVSLANMPAAPAPAGNGVITPLDPDESNAAPIELAADTAANVSAADNSLTLSGPMSGPGRTLTKNGDGLLALARLRAGGLQIDAGVVKLSPDGSVNATSTLDTLDIASGGNAKLDITGNKVIVHAGDVGTFDGVQYDGLTGQIAASYNVSGWDGPTGITTSMSDALSGVTTVAIASGEQVLFIAPSDTGVFAGQTITGAAVILAYTYAGDMNFDGLVDAADYGAIDNFVQFPGSFGYVNGDLNFDGVIDAGDYGIIDNTIQLQGPPIAMNGAAPGLTGVTPVPEPSACVFAILAATLIARRRRRRHRHRHRHRQELRQ